MFSYAYRALKFLGHVPKKTEPDLRRYKDWFTRFKRSVGQIARELDSSTTIQIVDPAIGIDQQS